VTPLWFAGTLRARLFTASVLLLTGSCNNKCTGERDEPEATPAIDRLEVIPAALSALVGVEFRLRVRLRDAEGRLLPDSRASEVVWALDDRYLQKVGIEGPDLVVKGMVAPEDAASLPVDAAVKATVNGRDATALVRLTDMGGPATDMVWADHVSAAPPVVALVDGMASVWRNDSMISFTTGAAWDDFGAHCQGTPANCGEAAVFARDRQVGYVEFAWTGQPELVNFSSKTLAQLTAMGLPVVSEAANEPLGQPLGVSVSVWIATAADLAAQTAREDLDYAFRVFRDSRTGLTLDTTIKTANPISLELDVVAPLGTCPPIIRQALEQEAGVDPRSFGGAKVTVAYVDAILEPAALGDSRTPSFYPAYACPWDSSNGSIVLISWDGRAHSDLAHEIAHAISPWWPPRFAESGHTNRLSGFAESNLMWPWESDDVPVSRAQLSLGQSFQLSVDSDALVNQPGGQRTGGLSKKCQVDDLNSTPCPRLAHDFVASP